MLSKTVSSPERPEVELELRQDRSHLNTAYHLAAADTPTVEQEYSAEPAAYSGIVELPMGLTRESDLNFAFLPVRSNQLCDSFIVHQQKRSGSFKKMSQGYRFAQRAHVVTAYPADTRLIDQSVRLELQFDTADNTIEDLNLDDALDDTMLVFAGDEILSIFDAELVGTGHYLVSVVRNRFGSPRLSHAVGDPLYVIPLEDLVWRNTSIRYFPVWRYQPGLSVNFAALTDCPDVTSTYRWVAYRPHGPANLRVNGDGKAPTCGTGESVTVDWTKTDKRRPYTDPAQNLNPSIDQTILQIRGLDDTLKSTITIGGSTPPYTITNAQIVAALGGELSFRLRTYFCRKYGFDSLGYDSITVTKV